MRIAVLGGAGKLGLGLISRLKKTGHDLAIGSRDPQKVAETTHETAGLEVRILSNEDAAQWCELAILTIPYSAHKATVSPLKPWLSGKIVIDATVPLDPGNLLRIKTESGTSAAEETLALIGGAFVFSAFQTVSHRTLRRVEVQEDVLVAGPVEHKESILQLIRELNLKAIDAGPLAVAGLLERMTPLLLSINKQNRIKDAGIKITGI